jgi:tripeptide aminopeptidase
MVNALKLANEFDSMLPADEVPERTADRQGFYHLTDSCGTAAHAELHYILRDHDSVLFAKRQETVKAVAETLGKKYPSARIQVEINEQYRNMAEVITQYPFLLTIAEDAIREIGLEPRHKPIRGGTDGARLSFMGLPCPNLGNGGYNAHSEREYVVTGEMLQAVQIVLNIIRNFRNL